MVFKSEDAKLSGYDDVTSGPVASEARALEFVVSKYVALWGAEMGKSGRTINDVLDGIASKIDGFAPSSAVTTSDGYAWAHALRFCTGSAEIMVLFPRMNSKPMERHVAVFAKSGTDAAAAASVMKQLNAGMKAERNSTFRNAMRQ